VLSRREMRQIARKHYMQCDGDIEACESALRKDPQLYGFDIATVLMIVQIALALWRFWSSHSISEPSIVATADEPGGDDDHDHD
jgi:hypothetical protein